MFRSRRAEPDPAAHNFLAEEIAQERRDGRRQATQLAVVFAGLFAFVFLAFWWSGAAVRFGASRVSSRARPTWRVWGVVFDARTHAPVPWARVEDDPAGRPPFFHTDAAVDGTFSLFTLAEHHRLQVSAPGYHTLKLVIGPQWFTWWPTGDERRDLFLEPQ